MSDPRIETAKKMQEEGIEAAKRALAVFEMADDLYTQCPKCGGSLRGTVSLIKAHICYADILCSP